FLISIISVKAQVSSNTCAESQSNTHITSEGVFSVGTINGIASTPNCYNDDNANNAEWFAYTPTSNFTVTITSDLEVNGDKDTRVHVYIGTCNNITCIGGDDDSGLLTGSNTSSFLSVFTFNATANQTYFIAWDNNWGDSSNFSFQVIENELVIPSDPA